MADEMSIEGFSWYDISFKAKDGTVVTGKTADATEYYDDIGKGDGNIVDVKFTRWIKNYAVDYAVYSSWVNDDDMIGWDPPRVRLMTIPVEDFESDPEHWLEVIRSRLEAAVEGEDSDL